MVIMKTDMISRVIKPKIMYYGTPVILLNTLNEDGTTNISPISSSWSLGEYIILGIGVDGKAFENLKREKECVINLPNPELWKNVEALAKYTGKEEVPNYKLEVGFTFKKDKYTTSNFTELDSLEIKPGRIKECPIQIEAVVENISIPPYSPDFAIIETKALIVHAHENIIKNENHIDPEKWSPLIYNFRHYFGLGCELGKTFRSET
jgi:flavin reductase (DIM6/NTAB) family NADH-FMN oxidoreductase RutF